jgi:hypothetical protein
MGHLLIQADARRIPLADRSIDLVFGSPPYCDARTYGIGAQRGCAEWVAWMLDVTTEALRVARNCVVWIAAGVTRDRTYWPACEGLMWEWWKRGGSAYRPCYWHRFGIPGSGGDDWFRADVEYAMCFKRPGAFDWSDNTAMGEPPKYGPEGAMSNRIPSGLRTGDRWVKSCTNGAGSGEVQTVRRGYLIPEKANPGNLIHSDVGGGKLGHPLAHENEAPFPEALAEFFIASLCPPGGIVADCFSGSGTTVSVAERLGRHGIGLDIRQSQAELARRRIERPHAPVARPGREESHPLFQEIS